MAHEIEEKEIVNAPNAAMKNNPPPASGKMSYEQFLAWADEDTLAEWVDGEVIEMSPASKLHQDLAAFLTALLRFFVEAHDLGIVIPAPFQMKISPDSSGREPDILFLAKANLDRLKPTYLAGAADLVIEIISPESRARDRGDKFYEYEAGRIREYWLLDPVRKQAEFYLLGDDDLYHLAIIGEDGIFRSRALEGLFLKVEWLWSEPLPALRDVLKEWRLI